MGEEEKRRRRKSRVGEVRREGGREEGGRQGLFPGNIVRGLGWLCSMSRRSSTKHQDKTCFTL